MVVKLPDSIVSYKPNLVVLTLFYACSYMPDKINIWIAWIIGLLVDGLNGFVLGNYALQFALLSAICIIFQTRMRMYSILQQTLILLFIGLLMTLFEFILRLSVKATLPHWQFWSPAIITAAIWPLFYLFFSSIRRKIYKVTSS